MNSKKPLVSIIILNWNGKKWLKNCLPAVRKIKYNPIEVLVVNNGSTDDSESFVKKNFPEFKLVDIKKNMGFAGANNYAIARARGKYVVMLNNDTRVTPNFLNHLVETMEKDKSIGAIQPQIRSLIDESLLDSAISYLTTTGFMYHFGYMKPWKRKMYEKPLFGYSIKGACMMMLRADYTRLGGLDEDFVCYVEESDLCHRVWLSGKKVLYSPESIIYHYGGGDMQVMTKDELTMFRSYRNRFISFIKNLSVLELIKTLPLLLLFCEAFIFMTLMNGNFRRAAGAQLGILSVPFTLSATLKKRRYIQTKIRRVDDSWVNQHVLKNPRFSYYYHFFKNPGGYKD